MAKHQGPAVADQPPSSTSVTPYDEAHFVTYLRLLDAEADGADWRDVSRLVLGLEPEANPVDAHRCWQGHLERAQWMSRSGYRQLLRDG